MYKNYQNLKKLADLYNLIVLMLYLKFLQLVYFQHKNLNEIFDILIIRSSNLKFKYSLL